MKLSLLLLLLSLIAHAQEIKRIDLVGVVQRTDLRQPPPPLPLAAVFSPAPRMWETSKAPSGR